MEERDRGGEVNEVKWDAGWMPSNQTTSPHLFPLFSVPPPLSLFLFLFPFLLFSPPFPSSLFLSLLHPLLHTSTNESLFYILKPSIPISFFRYFARIATRTAHHAQSKRAEHSHAFTHPLLYLSTPRTLDGSQSHLSLVCSIFFRLLRFFFLSISLFSHFFTVRVSVSLRAAHY